MIKKKEGKLYIEYMQSHCRIAHFYFSVESIVHMKRNVLKIVKIRSNKMKVSQKINDE